MYFQIGLSENRKGWVGAMTVSFQLRLVGRMERNRQIGVSEDNTGDS